MLDTGLTDYRQVSAKHLLTFCGQFSLGNDSVSMCYIKKSVISHVMGVILTNLHKQTGGLPEAIRSALAVFTSLYGSEAREYFGYGIHPVYRVSQAVSLNKNTSSPQSSKNHSFSRVWRQ